MTQSNQRLHFFVEFFPNLIVAAAQRFHDDHRLFLAVANSTGSCQGRSTIDTVTQTPYCLQIMSWELHTVVAGLGAVDWVHSHGRSVTVLDVTIGVHCEYDEREKMLSKSTTKRVLKGLGHAVLGNFVSYEL